MRTEDKSRSLQKPLSLADALSQEVLKGIRLVATDMDGTLTKDGLFTVDLLQAFEALNRCGIEIMIVTGRSAGWVSGLVHYLPVVGAIAENGGIYIDKQNPNPVVLPDIPRMSQHRDRLSKVFRRLRDRYPNLRPSDDNTYRLTDWTFDIAGLSESDLQWMQKTCDAATMGFTYSNVQCHIKVTRQNKADGIERLLKKRFSHLSAAEIITVGDSPNDESLFDQTRFPYSVGVANVEHYLPILTHRPLCVAHSPEVKGFVELVEQLVAART